MRRLVTCVVLVLSMPLLADDNQKSRQPQYPLKTRRMIVSDEELKQARENIAKYPLAKELAATIIKSADEWAAWTDQDLIALITDSRVPRAFDVSAVGCPVCGTQITEKHGSYAWIIDP